MPRTPSLSRSHYYWDSMQSVQVAWIAVDSASSAISAEHASSRLAMPNKPVKTKQTPFSLSRLAHPAIKIESLSKSIRLQATPRTHTRFQHQQRRRRTSKTCMRSLEERLILAAQTPALLTRQLKQTRISPIAFAWNAVFQPRAMPQLDYASIQKLLLQANILSLPNLTAKCWMD